MTQTIPLQAVANQAFSVTLDGVRYDFAIKETNGMMSADITRDEEVLLQGQRIVTMAPMIPYRYLAQDGGNFVLVTENDELPYFPQFGYTQQLVYLSAAEVIALGG